MSWTERPDSEDRCRGPMGAVAGRELVTRLLTNKNSEPSDLIFKRSQMTRPKQPSNDCGKSDGLSVDRCTELLRPELRARADHYAKKVEGRISRGAIVACVQALRDLRLPGLEEQQLLFVYDDPITGENERHAVVRASPSVSPARFSELRQELFKRFHSRISP